MKKQPITFNGSGLLLAFAGTVFLMSCNNLPVNFKKDKNKNAIARVNDKYLYSHDIKDLVPKDATPQDSSMVVKSFIDDWIKQNIVLHQAESNLLEEHKNVERQLQEYRNSLITFAYEQELVRQRLDTTVTEQEIEQYYNDNSDCYA